jgi:hypothetical protein
MTTKLVDDLADAPTNKTREAVGQGIADIVTGTNPAGAQRVRPLSEGYFPGPRRHPGRLPERAVKRLPMALPRSPRTWLRTGARPLWV